MSEQDPDSKTEEPTPRRREEFRKRGEVVFSREVMAVTGIAAGALSLIIVASFALEQMAALWLMIGDKIGSQNTTLDQRFFETLMFLFIKVLAVPATISIAATLAVGLAQTRFNWSWKPLEFKPEKLNPFPKLKKMFFSLNTLVELAKSLAKLTALTVISWFILSSEVFWLTRMPHLSLEDSLSLVGEMLIRLMFTLGFALAVLAAIDYAWQWYQLNKKMRMSKQDIKDEVKQSEGDPLVQGQRRARQREMARQRANIMQTEDATVVIVNPTHVAVALRYVPGQDAAPLVLCKGMDQVAAEIRAIARKAGVPIIQRRQLARLLYKTSKPGKVIPVDLYEATAEVLAVIMQQKRARENTTPS